MAVGLGPLRGESWLAAWRYKPFFSLAVPHAWAVLVKGSLAHRGSRPSMPHQRLVLVLINAAELSVDTNIVVTYTIPEAKQDQGVSNGQVGVASGTAKEEAF